MQVGWTCMKDRAKARWSAPPPWFVRGGWLVRIETFEDFPQAMSWVRRVAFEAERWNHHPDIHVRWNTVTLKLRTHDAGGLTDRDRHWVEATRARLHRPNGATGERPLGQRTLNRG